VAYVLSDEMKLTTMVDCEGHL